MSGERPLRLAIVRSDKTPIDRRFYNSQELGLGSALLGEGVDVDVFVVGAGSGVTETIVVELGERRLRLIEVPCRVCPLIEQGTMPAVRRYIRQGNYDFVQVNESNQVESWLTAHAARRKGVPVALYQGMYRPLAGRIQSIFQSAFDRVCLPRLVSDVSLPLAKTQWAANHMVERGFSGTQVLPVGLDPGPFQDEEPVDWRQRFVVPEHHQLLTYVGVLEPRRRPDLIVELATRMRDRPVSFVVAGTGPSEADVRRLIDERALGHMHLVGRLSQTCLPSLYRDSALFLLPSTYEIYGMVVLEAMYFGLPVLASRTAGPEAMIESGVDGCIVDNLDPDTWQAAIERAIAAPGELARWGHAAEAKVGSWLTWSCIATRYAELLRRVISEGANTGCFSYA